MRKSLKVAFVVAGALGATVALAGHGTPAFAIGACGPTKVAGATVVVHCGPAKATFAFGGRKYRVSGGTCSLEKGYGITAWSLNVGRQALPPAPPKYLEFHVAYTGKPKAGTYSKGEYVVSFATPGTAWSLAPGLPHKVTVATAGKKGTFSGAFYTGSKSGTRQASGSWTC
jgi:hypothetical protein